MRWLVGVALVIIPFQASAKCSAGLTAHQQQMIYNWKQCLDEAVDRFAEQRETATTVADAALSAERGIPVLVAMPRDQATKLSAQLQTELQKSPPKLS